MKKKIIYLSLLFCFICLFVNSVSAVNYSDSNNPGSGGGGTSAGANSGTSWQGSIKAVRIRVFRGGVKQYSGYFSLADAASSCITSIEARLCETSSYNYSSVTNSSNATCATSATTTNLGCIVSSNLSSTFAIKTYNGTYLDNYLKNNSYKNLKEVLAGMGYNDSNAQNDDVVIVEPATRVTCAGKYYFGTSTAMMLKNISYRGASGNMCSASDNDYSDADTKPDGKTFQNLFRSMSTALKVSTHSSWQGNNTYTGFGYFKYNVSDMGYTPPPEPEKYTLDLNYCVDGIIDYQLPRYPTNFSYDFKLNNVNSDSTYFLNSISSGTSYGVSLTETSSDYTFKGYHVGGGGSCTVTDTSNSISGTVTGDTSIDLVFESTCSKKLKNLKQNDGSYNASDLFDLYKFYLDKSGSEKKDYRGLLNISNPSCTTKTPPSKEINNLTCLSGSTLSHENFNEFNLTDYDEIVTSSDGKYAGFCLSSMYLENNLGVHKFYSKSGQFLIRQLNDNSKIQIYNSSYNLLEVDSTDVATTTIRKICYVLPNRVSYYNDYSSEDHVNLYFGDNNMNNKAEHLSKENINIIKDGTNGSNKTNGLRQHEYEKEIKYKLNTVYLENISGKTVNSSKNYLNGVLSKFNATNGTIPFKITYRGKTYGEGKDLCTYETKPELIGPPNELNLEFRIIDTTTPFNRKTMTNWSNGTDNSKDNETVKTYIIDATNSYGIKKGVDNQTPKYTITLTSTEIKNIREYNKNVPYDNYKIDCNTDSNNNEVCKNTFLENLKNGKVIIYDGSGDVIKTLINNQKLNVTI